MNGDPWAALSRRTDLVLLDAPMPERGRYYHRFKAIVLRRGMSLVEQRVTLWHELVHAERGDETCTSKYEHTRVEREAARRAIDVHDLAEALRWSQHPSEVADQLKVTEELLHVRLDALHPAERGLLERAVAMKEHTA